MRRPKRAELEREAKELLDIHGEPAFRKWRSPIEFPHTETPMVGFDINVPNRPKTRVDFQVRTDGNFIDLIQRLVITGQEISERLVYTFRGPRKRNLVNPRKIDEIPPEVAAKHLKRIKAALGE